MIKTISALVAVGAMCTASLPASAQMGHLDPGFGAGQPSVTQVAFRGGGHRFRPGWHGGWRGGGGGYGWRHRGGRGFGIGAGVAGLAAGALIGGAIASQAAPAYGYGYGYGAPVYGAPAYDPSVEYAAQPDGGGSVAYCTQRFKSYDPSSGTYLGYDGLRHPCP